MDLYQLVLEDLYLVGQEGHLSQEVQVDLLDPGVEEVRLYQVVEVDLLYLVVEVVLLYQEEAGDLLFQEVQAVLLCQEEAGDLFLAVQEVLYSLELAGLLFLKGLVVHHDQEVLEVLRDQEVLKAHVGFLLREEPEEVVLYLFLVAEEHFLY